MDEWLWMCSMPGFYRNDFARLLQFFESPEEIRKSEKKQISLLPFLKDRQKEGAGGMEKSFCRRNQA